ncbi:MAG: hypothetical protein ABEJ06_04745 [Haloarculaceae archaeon]
MTLPGPLERVRSFVSWWMVALWVTVTLAAFFALRTEVPGEPVGLALWGGFLYTAVIVLAVQAARVSYRLLRRAVRGPDDLE